MLQLSLHKNRSVSTATLHYKQSSSFSTVLYKKTKIMPQFSDYDRVGLILLPYP